MLRACRLTALPNTVLTPRMAALSGAAQSARQGLLLEERPFARWAVRWRVPGG